MRAAFIRKIFEHAGMLEDECHAGCFRRQRCRIRHLACEDLEIERPAVIGEPGEIAPKRLVFREIGPLSEAIHFVFVPVQLHAHAAHALELAEPVELRRTSSAMKSA